MEQRASERLAQGLIELKRKYPGFRLKLDHFSLSTDSATVQIRIEHDDIWESIESTADAMVERLKQSLEAKFGCQAEVCASEGSLTLAIILYGFEAARLAYDFVTSLFTLVEYVIRCVVNERMDWPPIAAMFTFFEALKRFLLGF
jgi:hypothetical protein